MSEAVDKAVRRFGQVIGLRPESLEAYKQLHAGPGVRDLLRRANIRNFSIFVQRMPDGKLYEFGYFEYHGDDFERDMAWLGAQPENKAWLALCDPMQIPLEGETSWSMMEPIFYNE
jgi:L-rhamnose mutarotase